MRRSIGLATIVALLGLVIPMGAASATSPALVQFEVPTSIPPGGGPGGGPFTATGAAVDAGIICPSGDTVDVFGKASGFSQTGVNFQVVKLFTCDDGSGEFLVKLQVRLDFRGDDFQWTIVGGTDGYGQLHGSGSGVGVPIAVGVLDLYEGGVHLD